MYFSRQYFYSTVLRITRCFTYLVLYTVYRTQYAVSIYCTQYTVSVTVHCLPFTFTVYCTRLKRKEISTIYTIPMKEPGAEAGNELFTKFLPFHQVYPLIIFTLHTGQVHCITILRCFLYCAVYCTQYSLCTMLKRKC